MFMTMAVGNPISLLLFYGRRVYSLGVVLQISTDGFTNIDPGTSRASIQRFMINLLKVLHRKPGSQKHVQVVDRLRRIDNQVFISHLQAGQASSAQER